MRTPATAARLGFLVSGVLIGVLIIAAPVLGIDPSPSAGTPDGPGKAARPDKPGKSERALKVKTPEAAVTRTGTVATTTNAEGETAYTLNVDGTIYVLDAGPSWWWGAKHPLAASVGKRVVVVGEQAEGSSEIDVKTVDGKVIRAEGRPPWAGGWKVVGEKHPGWAQWKVDKAAAKGQRGLGRAGAPGQLKDKSLKPDASAGPD